MPPAWLEEDMTAEEDGRALPRLTQQGPWRAVAERRREAYATYLLVRLRVLRFLKPCRRRLPCCCKQRAAARRGPRKQLAQPQHDSFDAQQADVAGGTHVSRDSVLPLCGPKDKVVKEGVESGGDARVPEASARRSCRRCIE